VELFACQEVIAADVTHFDESCVLVSGLNQWLGMVCTRNQAFYTIRPMANFRCMTVRHSLCNAHLLQELGYFEKAKGSHHWPIRLQETSGGQRSGRPYWLGVTSVETGGLQLFPEKPRR